MEKVFMVVYYGIEDNIPVYTAFRDRQSAVNFILEQYEKEYPNMYNKEDSLDFDEYPTPFLARQQFEEYSGIPYFASITTLDVNE